MIGDEHLPAQVTLGGGSAVDDKTKDYKGLGSCSDAV